MSAADVGQAPLADVEAEASVLGAALLVPNLIPTIAVEAGLRPEHFYTERYAGIWAAMLALSDRGDGVDTLTVAAECKRRKVHGADRAEVDSLCGVVPAAGNIGTYARRVVELAGWRQKQHAAYGILAAAQDQDDDALSAAEGLLNVETTERQAFSSAQMADELYRFAEGGQVEAWPLPFSVLSTLLAGGFKRGAWTVLSGHSSWGKSAFAGQCAETVARELTRLGSKGGVRYYVVEGEPLDLALRAVSRHSSLNFGRVARGKLHEDELGPYLNAVQWWHDLGVTLVPAAGWTPEQIARDVRRNRPDFWVVDLLNELDVGRGETYDWDRAVRTLGAVPKQTGSHLLLVAHLNEARVQTKRPKPTLGDLRSTGMLKNASDNVIFVYREQSSDGTEIYDDGEIYIAKARNARLGGLPVCFRGAQQRFEGRAA